MVDGYNYHHTSCTGNRLISNNWLNFRFFVVCVQNYILWGSITKIIVKFFSSIRERLFQNKMKVNIIYTVIELVHKTFHFFCWLGREHATSQIVKSLTRGKISSKTFNSLGGRHQRIYERTQERSIFNNLDTKRYWYCCRLHSSPYKSSMHQERCDDYLECVFSHKVIRYLEQKNVKDVL